MAVDVFFDRKEAEEKGVVFTPEMREVLQHEWHCDLLRVAGSWYPECTCRPERVEKPFGWYVQCPDGSKGYAMGFEFFQCKNINQEIRAWFLNNLESAELDF